MKNKVSSLIKKSVPVVGIGASAGGLDAFIQFLSKVPADTGLAFVLIQHLEPTHPSLSVSILAKSTLLEIEEVKDGTVVKPNHIYMIPPNHHLSLLNNTLYLSSRSEKRSRNMSIDFFFQSLAKSLTNRSIGIILSGKGTDGTLGLKAIKEAGGATFAQAPQTAKYPNMPQNAINSGAAIHILTLDDMASFFSTISVSKPSGVLSNSLDDSLNKILAQLLKYTKVDFSEYKKSTIDRRIQRRMSIKQIKNLDSYNVLLENSPAELESLYKDLLINVTHFFRDSNSFIGLKTHVFPSLIKQRQNGRPIRIWVPGCSSGEEVYSIAISLTEYLRAVKRSFPIQIFATDISDDSLKKSRLGIYSSKSMIGVSKDRKERFFESVPEGFRIQKSIRDICLFSKHDLIQDPPFARLDFISCRNVLIYFATELQRRVFPIFHYALGESGILWLGKSETPGENSKLFTPIEKSFRFFRRMNIATPLNKQLPLTPMFKSLPTNEKLSIKPPLATNIQRIADELMLSKFAPPSVIFNSDLEILQFRGRTSPFLEPSVGQPSLNLIKMIRPEILRNLHSALQFVLKENKAILRKDIQFKIDGEFITFDYEIIPLNSNKLSGDRNYLILFKFTDPSMNLTTTILKPKQPLKKVSTQNRQNQKISDLEQELVEVEEQQRLLIYQYEQAQLNLTTANQELQSSNEEFLSSNEEIETAKEELQSTNEELITLNDELQVRIADLTTLSNDLNNILSSVEIPILIVGQDKRIRLFSPKAKNAFNLIASDIGRPLSDINPNFDLDLGRLVLKLASDPKPIEREVRDINGAWLRVQIQPYKTFDNKIEGAVIALVDIELLKQRESKIKDSLNYVTSVAEAVPLPLAVVSGNFKLKSANQAFYRFFQLNLDSVGKEILKFLNSRNDSVEPIHQLISKTIRDGKLFEAFETTIDLPSIGQRNIIVSGQKISWAEASPDAVLLNFLDITDRFKVDEERSVALVRLEEARNEADMANNTKDLFLANLSHELRTPLSAILSWAQLIAQGDLNLEKTKEGATVIEKSAKVQSQLIDDLLDISRITSGKLNLEFVSIDPADIVKLAIDSVRAMSEKKSIELKCTLDTHSEPLIADPVRLQQILWNLLTNAIKFSPTGGVIELKLKYVNDLKKTFVVITIADQGKGISPDFLPMIFDKFTQAKSNKGRQLKGLGLGLSIVRSLVELHSGWVKAENLSAGTRAIFTFCLPLNPTTAQNANLPAKGLNQELTSEKGHPIQTTPNLAGITILLVDDDTVLREVLTLNLNLLGAKVIQVGTALEALHVLSSISPNILVSDISMPDHDGYFLIQTIRNFTEVLKRTLPALALTAHANASDANKALQAGYQAHIAKPVDSKLLGNFILKYARQNK